MSTAKAKSHFNLNLSLKEVTLDDILKGYEEFDIEAVSMMTLIPLLASLFSSQVLHTNYFIQNNKIIFLSETCLC